MFGTLERVGIYDLAGRNKVVLNWGGINGLVRLKPCHSVRMIGRLTKSLTAQEAEEWGHLTFGMVLPTWIGTHEDCNKIQAHQFPTTPWKLHSDWAPRPCDGCILDRSASVYLDRPLTLVRRYLNDGHLTEGGPKMVGRGQSFRQVKLDESFVRVMEITTGISLPQSMPLTREHLHLVYA